MLFSTIRTNSILILYLSTLSTSGASAGSDFKPYRNISDNTGWFYFVGIFSVRAGQEKISSNKSAMFLHLAFKCNEMFSTRTYINWHGFISYDVCKNATYMTEVALSFVLDMKFKNVQMLSIFIDGAEFCPCPYSKSTNIIAIVIYGSDEMTKISK